MLRKIYRELVRIRKELHAIRHSIEFSSIENRNIQNYIPYSSISGDSGNAHTSE